MGKITILLEMELCKPYLSKPYSCAAPIRLFSGRGCGSLILLLLVIFFSCKGHWLASFLPSICACISIDSIAQPILTSNRRGKFQSTSKA